MEDSTSDATRDGVDTQTYSISSEDFHRLRLQVAALEAEARVVDTYSGRPYPSAILQTACDINKSLEKITATASIITPEASMSGDSPIEPEKDTPKVCRHLLNGGIVFVLHELAQTLYKLGAGGDSAAAMCAFFYELDWEHPIMDEFLSIVFSVVEDDHDIVYDFRSRIRKMTIDYFSHAAQSMSVEELADELNTMPGGDLKEELNSMSVEELKRKLDSMSVEELTEKLNGMWIDS